MLGRLLCRLGHHRWDYLYEFVFASYEVCSRCGVQRQEVR